MRLPIRTWVYQLIFFAIYILYFTDINVIFTGTDIHCINIEFVSKNLSRNNLGQTVGKTGYVPSSSAQA